MDLRAGERVLDVASGSGNAALAAARRNASVTATDIVPELLAQARVRAAAELVELETVEADAAALPFDDESFEVVTSAIGVMFVPDQQRAADEMLRVLRPGGRIALASWCPDALIGEILQGHRTACATPARRGIALPVGDCRRSRRTAGTAHRMAPTGAPEPADAVRLGGSRRRPLRHHVRADDEGPVAARRARSTRAARRPEGVVESRNVATDGTLVCDWDYLLAVGSRL